MPDLDQFYTKPEVARECWESLKPIAKKLTHTPLNSLFFVEPGAGDGAFYDLLPESRRVGLDLDPRADGILKRDFLKCRPHTFIPPEFDSEQIVIIGNPPFGKRGRLAVEFVNKAFTMADTVAFIVPVIFSKYFIHKQITQDAKLIHTSRLDKLSFRTAAKPDYPVNTEFQIWTRLESDNNLREYTPPKIAHPDFVMHQYNNTREALKIFDMDFDFAVPCQGWQDYARRETCPQGCEKNKQWMLFKSDRTKIRNRLFKFKFEELAHKYTTSVPGFRKGDVVKEYTEAYG